MCCLRSITYFDWSSSLLLEDLGTVVAQCTEEGPLYRAALTAEEVGFSSLFLSEVGSEKMRKRA